MNERRANDYVRRDLAAIPPYIWVLALVVVLLAAVACGLWAVYALRLQWPLAGPSPTPVIWTTTPEPTPTLPPTSTETPIALPTASPDIAIGWRVQVSGTEGKGVNLRQEPDVNSPRISTDLEQSIGSEGEIFIVVDGPRRVSGYIWWLVQDLEDETRQGWAVGNYLAPVVSDQ
jgi:hypothetical protein